LKAGAHAPYFGVINIGDVTGLRRLIERKGISCEDDAISGSLFSHINDPNSTVTVLIGARKFVEVTKYHTQLSLYTFPFLILMNKKVWNNFPSEIQKQIMGVAGSKGAAFLSGNVWDFGAKKTAKMLSEMKGEEIIRLSDQELETWGKYAPAVHQKYIADLEAKGLPGRALYDELLRQIKKYK